MSNFGPWMGVPKSRQSICAVAGCSREGKPHVCPWDGSDHHHGCIHYDCPAAEEAVAKAGLTFRPGWGLICDAHYAMLTGRLVPV